MDKEYSKIVKGKGNVYIKRYELSRDGLGLIAFFDDETRPNGESYYHIHSNELTEDQKGMRDLFIKMDGCY